jgi:uncharacterized protein
VTDRARRAAASRASGFSCRCNSGQVFDLKDEKRNLPMNNAKEVLYVFNVTRQTFLSLGVVPADTHFARLRGLLGKLKLRNDEGIWVVPSSGIHTFGLLFPIDVIYLDERNRVIHLVEHLGPLRISAVRRGCSSVLELPPRTIHSSNTRVGDDLLICSPEELLEYSKTALAQRQLENDIELTG